MSTIDNDANSDRIRYSSSVVFHPVSRLCSSCAIYIKDNIFCSCFDSQAGPICKDAHKLRRIILPDHLQFDFPSALGHLSFERMRTGSRHWGLSHDPRLDSWCCRMSTALSRKPHIDHTVCGFPLDGSWWLQRTKCSPSQNRKG